MLSTTITMIIITIVVIITTITFTLPPTRETVNPIP